jgi:RNA polymerase sigma-70 factor (ECF subfamily)
VDELTVLALNAAQGSQESLADVIRRTQNDVWRLCAHLVDQQSANDLTQETYERAVRQLHRFRGDGPVRSWLLTIARRVCAAEVSARQRERDTSLTLSAARQPVGVSDQTYQVEMSLLLDALEPDRRAAFVLTQMLGFSYDETAHICECPIGTVRSRVARARDDLIGLTADTSNQAFEAP